MTVTLQKVHGKHCLRQLMHLYLNKNKRKFVTLSKLPKSHYNVLKECHEHTVPECGPRQARPDMATQRNLSSDSEQAAASRRCKSTRR